MQHRFLAQGVRTAIAVAIGAGSLFTATIAQADVVSSGPVNITIPVSLNGLYLNVVTGANNLPPPGTGGTTVPGWDINPYGTTTLSFFSASPTASSGYVGSGTTTANLAAGTIVGPGSTFVTATNTPPATSWNLNSSDNFVGFRFLNESGGTVHYGYFQLSLGASVLQRSVVSYAFESTPNTAITVVPEPGTYVLMAMGLAGLLAARRRQQARG